MMTPVTRSVFSGTPPSRGVSNVSPMAASIVYSQILSICDLVFSRGN